MITMVLNFLAFYVIYLKIVSAGKGFSPKTSSQHWVIATHDTNVLKGEDAGKEIFLAYNKEEGSIGRSDEADSVNNVWNFFKADGDERSGEEGSDAYFFEMKPFLDLNKKLGIKKETGTLEFLDSSEDTKNWEIDFQEKDKIHKLRNGAFCLSYHDSLFHIEKCEDNMKEQRFKITEAPEKNLDIDETKNLGDKSNKPEDLTKNPDKDAKNKAPPITLDEPETLNVSDKPTKKIEKPSRHEIPEIMLVDPERESKEIGQPKKQTKVESTTITGMQTVPVENLVKNTQVIEVKTVFSTDYIHSTLYSTSTSVTTQKKQEINTLYVTKTCTVEEVVTKIEPPKTKKTCDENGNIVVKTIDSGKIYDCDEKITNKTSDDSDSETDSDSDDSTSEINKKNKKKKKKELDRLRNELSKKINADDLEECSDSDTESADSIFSQLKEIGDTTNNEYVKSGIRVPKIFLPPDKKTGKKNKTKGFFKTSIRRNRNKKNKVDPCPEGSVAVNIPPNQPNNIINPPQQPYNVINPPPQQPYNIINPPPQQPYQIITSQQPPQPQPTYQPYNPPIQKPNIVNPFPSPVIC